MVQTISQGTWLRWLQSRSSEKQSPWVALSETLVSSLVSKHGNPVPLKKRMIRLAEQTFENIIKQDQVQTNTHKIMWQEGIRPLRRKQMLY